MSETELRYAICKLEERIARLELESIKVGDVIRTESHIHDELWRVNEFHITEREKGET